MKGPITAVQARWKLAGVDPSSGYTYQTFPLGVPVNIHRLTPGLAYEVGLRYLGPLPSDWTTITHTIASTSQLGGAALPPVIFGNVGSRWVDGMAVSWTATETVAVIGVDSGTLQVGDRQINYTGVFGEIDDGAADEVRTVHLYYDDPKREGGVRTLGITTDITETSAAYGRIYIATITITFASSGGSGTAGGGPIGGGGGGSGQIEP